MTPARRSLDGVVLSGGGALGAFEVGVLKALAAGRSPATDYQPLTVEVFSGTSVGAYNAAFLAARGAIPTTEATDQLVEVWLHELADGPMSCGTAAYRLRTGPFTLQPGCLARPFELAARGVADATYWTRYAAVRGSAFVASREPLQARLLNTLDLAAMISPAPLYELIQRTIGLEGLRRSRYELAVAATNWREGSLVMFSKRDIVEEVGLAAIAASAALPGIYPQIELRGVPFADGGVLQNTPIKPAIEGGADVIHVIFVDPEVTNIPIAPVPNTISTIYRTWAIIQSKQINLDILEADEIVRELNSLRRKGVLAEDYQSLSGDATEEVATVRRIREGRRPYRPLVIHRYRPRRSLGTGNVFDFRSEMIETLIEMGFANAAEHDCEQEGCVRAEEAVAEARRVRSA